MAASHRRAERTDLLERIGRLALWAFPRRFRRRHGAELLRLHRDLLRQQQGAGVPVREVVAMAVDLVSAGLAARRETLVGGRGPGSWGTSMDTLLQDTRFALRTLARRPGFAIIAILSLALGIGANAVVFSMVDAFILRPMPYSEPEELLHVWSLTRQGPRRVSVPNYLDWRQATRAFAGLAAFNYTIETLTGGEVPEQVSGARISANALPLLGVEPMLGRGFATGEDRMAADPVALISQGFWRERYSSDPGVLGTTLEVDGVSYTIVGVVADGMNFPLPTTEIWLPRFLDDPRYTRDRQIVQVFGRLAPGVSEQQARTEMEGIATRLEERFPDVNEGLGVRLEPLKVALNFADEILRPVSALLMAAVGFVLLIACANVASLMLARATTRGRELALRSALGAGRRRLVRQMLTESVIVALGGGALGLLLAVRGTASLDAAIPADLYRVGSISVDGTVLGYTLLLSLATALVFGTLPALRATRGDLVDGLKQGTAGSGTGRRGVRLQAAMVVAEMTLSIVLLVGTGLMIRSFLNMQEVDPGFRSDGVLSVRMLLPSSRYSDTAIVGDFHRRLLARSAALPGVSDSAIVDYLPLNHEYNLPEFSIVGKPDPAEPRSAVAVAVSPDYFRVMGIPVFSGRTFESDEPSPGDRREVLVDSTTAERFWGDESPLGQTIDLDSGVRAEVVGVVGAVREVDLAGAGEPVIYTAQADAPDRYMRLLVRTDGDPASLATAVRAAIAEVDPLLPVSDVRTLRQVVDDFLMPWSMVVLSLAMMAAGALLLAAVGVYGLMSFFVAQRTRDFGVHMALGATAAGVRRMIVTRVLTLSAWGVGLGLAAALAVTRLMGSLLYGVGAVDPVAFGGTVLFLVVVALAAGLAGARRATRVDPVSALRAE